MKKLIACLALAAMFAGCSSNPPQTPQEKQASLLIEMQMQKKSYLKQHIPAGIGNVLQKKKIPIIQTGTKKSQKWHSAGFTFIEQAVE